MTQIADTASRLLSEIRIGSCIAVTARNAMVKGKVIFIDSGKIEIQDRDKQLHILFAKDISGFTLLQNEDDALDKPDTEVSSPSELSSEGHSQKTEAPHPDDDKISDIAERLNRAIRNEPFFKTGEALKTSHYRNYSSNSKGAISKAINAIIKKIPARTDTVDIAEFLNQIAPDLNRLKSHISNGNNSTIYNFLGSLYYRFRKNYLALENFELGDDNVSGFNTARICKNAKKMMMFALRHVFDKYPKHPVLIEYLLRSMVENDDLSLVPLLLNSKNQNPKHSNACRALLVSVLKAYGLAEIDDSADGFSFREIKTLCSQLHELQTNRQSYFLYILCCSNNIRLSGHTQNLLSAYDYFATEDDAPPYSETRSASPLYAEIQAIPETETADGTGRKNSKTADYLQIAQKYETHDRNYKKAVEYYLLAIENRQNPEASILGCARLLSHQGLYEKAFALLDEHKKDLVITDFLITKINLCLKSQDIRYMNECLDSVNELLSVTKNAEERIKIMMDASRYLYSVGEYQQCADNLLLCYDEFKKIESGNTEETGNTAVRQNSKILETIYTTALKAYIKLRDKSYAYTFALKLQEIQPGSRLAQTVIDNNYEEAENLVTSQNLIKLAQEADAIEKNLPKAIEYYKEAISQQQQLTTSVPNLVSIYNRLNSTKESLELLNMYGEYLDTKVCLNLKISTYEKSKNPAYKQECMDAFNNLIQITDDKLSKVRSYLNCGIYLFNIGEYQLSAEKINEAAVAFKEIADFCDIRTRTLISESIKNNYNRTCQKLKTVPASMEIKALIGDRKSSAMKPEAETEDYYKLGQEAKSKNDLDKAAELFLLAINHKNNISKAVIGLVDTYKQSRKFAEALDTLNNYRNTLPLDRYLKTKINLIVLSANKVHREEMLKAAEAYSSISKNRKDKAKTIIQVGYYFIATKDFDTAIRLLAECASEIDNKFSKEEKASIIAHIQTLYQHLLTAYTSIHDNNKAFETAKVLLEINKTNPAANNYIRSAGTENRNNLAAQHSHEIFSKTTVFSHIENLIDQASLKSVINVKEIKDGRFTGSADKAKEILLAANSFLSRKSLNFHERTNAIFAYCKLIKQTLENRDNIYNDPYLNNRLYFDFIAKAALELGNSRLYSPNSNSFNASFETARFIYLQAVYLFSHNETHASDSLPKDYITAIYRYIGTFFYSDADISRIRKITYSESENDIKTAFSDYINNLMTIGLSKNNDITSFVVDMMLLLGKAPVFENAVLSVIFFKFIRDDVAHVLERISMTGVPLGISATDFRDFWFKSKNILFSRLETLISDIHKTVMNVFVISDFVTNLETLKSSQIDCILNRLDQNIIREFLKILDKLYRFHQISDFEYKSEVLRDTEKDCQNLLKYIRSFPTFFSSEFLAKELHDLNRQIMNESEYLYSNALPRIALEVVGDCSVSYDDRTVTVPVALKNEQNAQTAIVTSFSASATGCETIEDFQTSNIFHVGGTDVQRLLKFKVPKRIMDEDVLEFSVSVSYQYKTNMTTTLEKNESFSFSVKLNKEMQFSQIDNKFDVLRDGNPVSNPEMFYGREKDIQFLISQIEKSVGASQGRCIALYGQTRTGKSSVLLHLNRRLRKASSDFIIINLDSIGDQNLHDNNITDFLYSIMDVLKIELSSNHPELYRILREKGLDLNPDILLEREDDAQLIFNAGFRQLSSILAGLERKYQLVLTIDEFTYIYDWIRQEKMTDRIMKFWKALIQNYGIFAVIIGQDHMMKFVKDERFTNDFGATDLKKVTYLSRDDAFRLMDEPIMFRNSEGKMESRYKSGALERLYELTAGSAFLIGKLCAELVDYINKIRSVYITKAHIDAYLKANLANFEEAKFFDPQFHDKSDIRNEGAVIEQNKEILKRIALVSNSSGWASLNKVISSAIDRQLIANLEERDVLIVEKNERCRIKVALYREWLIEKYGW